jgi:alkanesulfonate monooxygenase SsuD/methylene tetrahydromethanopterin reductase-like flavin-dependent oxidoreductase (luciferase family)
VGLGSREDDYTASGLTMKGRGKRFDQMLDQIRRLFDGEEVGYAGGVGPDVSDDPPQLIVGGGRGRGLPPRGAVRQRLDHGRRAAGALPGPGRQADGRLA